MAKIRSSFFKIDENLKDLNSDIFFSDLDFEALEKELVSAYDFSKPHSSLLPDFWSLVSAELGSLKHFVSTWINSVRKDYQMRKESILNLTEFLKSLRRFIELTLGAKLRSKEETREEETQEEESTDSERVHQQLVEEESVSREKNDDASSLGEELVPLLEKAREKRREISVLIEEARKKFLHTVSEGSTSTDGLDIDSKITKIFDDASRELHKELDALFFALKGGELMKHSKEDSEKSSEDSNPPSQEEALNSLEKASDEEKISKYLRAINESHAIKLSKVGTHPITSFKLKENSIDTQSNSNRLLDSQPLSMNGSNEMLKSLTDSEKRLIVILNKYKSNLLRFSLRFKNQVPDHSVLRMNFPVSWSEFKDVDERAFETEKFIKSVRDTFETLQIDDCLTSNTIDSANPQNTLNDDAVSQEVKNKSCPDLLDILLTDSCAGKSNNTFLDSPSDCRINLEKELRKKSTHFLALDERMKEKNAEIQRKFEAKRKLIAGADTSENSSLAESYGSDLERKFPSRSSNSFFRDAAQFKRSTLDLLLKKGETADRAEKAIRLLNVCIGKTMMNIPTMIADNIQESDAVFLTDEEQVYRSQLVSAHTLDSNFLPDVCKSENDHPPQSNMEREAVGLRSNIFSALTLLFTQLGDGNSKQNTCFYEKERIYNGKVEDQIEEDGFDGIQKSIELAMKKVMGVQERAKEELSRDEEALGRLANFEDEIKRIFESKVELSTDSDQLGTTSLQMIFSSNSDESALSNFLGFEVLSRRQEECSISVKAFETAISNINQDKDQVCEIAKSCVDEYSEKSTKVQSNMDEKLQLLDDTKKILEKLDDTSKRFLKMKEQIHDKLKDAPEKMIKVSLTCFARLLFEDTRGKVPLDQNSSDEEVLKLIFENSDCPSVAEEESFEKTLDEINVLWNRERQKKLSNFVQMTTRAGNAECSLYKNTLQFFGEDLVSQAIGKFKEEETKLQGASSLFDNDYASFLGQINNALGSKAKNQQDVLEVLRGNIEDTLAEVEKVHVDAETGLLRALTAIHDQETKKTDEANDVPEQSLKEECFTLLQKFQEVLTTAVTQFEALLDKFQMLKKLETERSNVRNKISTFKEKSSTISCGAAATEQVGFTQISNSHQIPQAESKTHKAPAISLFAQLFGPSRF
eukprot:GDKJ01016708.1.p1 GENE.GDKJ01016708.1~~GDKJ01016708.1.p1  ORF type:complete len:1302 (-),score=323.35 GDKJ01016708.1:66-3524(-)